MFGSSLSARVTGGGVTRSEGFPACLSSVICFHVSLKEG